MKTVTKVKVPKEKSFSLELPFNSEILQMFVEENQPYLLVLEDSEGKKVEREFVSSPVGNFVDQRFNRTHFVGSYGVLHEGEQKSICVFEKR